MRCFEHIQLVVDTLVGQTQDRDYVSFWLVTPQSPLRRAGDGGCGEEDLAISA